MRVVARRAGVGTPALRTSMTRGPALTARVPVGLGTAMATLLVPMVWTGTALTTARVFRKRARLATTTALALARAFRGGVLGAPRRGGTALATARFLPWGTPALAMAPGVSRCA